MEARSLKYVAEACGGQLRGGAPELQVRGVSTDSRRAQAGELFIALRGERFDGHDYLDEARQRGAAAVMIERARSEEPGGRSGPAVVVDHTRVALGRLAARYRRDFDLPVIVVGGSNGKTTTKELVASVLRTRLTTLSNEASFNNDVGVPLTLLRLARGQAAAVFEVGTNHPGELAPLVRMAQPRLGIVTSLGREHLAFFGDVAGVAAEEGWLPELLPAHGKLFVNGDSDGMDAVTGRCRAPVVRVGLGATHDWRARDLRWDERGVSFQVAAPRTELSGAYRVNLLGHHQVVNALLALAVGAELGLAGEDLRRGLAECQPLKMRLQLQEVRGARVLNDAYNANADSMLAALQTLHDLPCAGRRLAVLGEMAELGQHSLAAHQEVGRRAAELGLDGVWTVGPMAGHTARAARDAGLAAAWECGGMDEAAAALGGELKRGDVVLVKGSRSARLERLVERLAAGQTGPPGGLEPGAPNGNR